MMSDTPKPCPECGGSLAVVELRVSQYAVTCREHGDHERTQAMFACVRCGCVVDAGAWIQLRFTPDSVVARVN